MSYIVIILCVLVIGIGVLGRRELLRMEKQAMKIELELERNLDRIRILAIELGVDIRLQHEPDEFGVVRFYAGPK